MADDLDLEHLKNLCRDDYAGELGVPADQVLALLAEVERLRAEVALLRVTEDLNAAEEAEFRTTGTREQTEAVRAKWRAAAAAYVAAGGVIDGYEPVSAPPQGEERDGGEREGEGGDRG